MSRQCFSWVLEREKTTEGTDRLVLCILAFHANEKLGFLAWPSVERIALEARVSTRAVQRSLAALKAAGLITTDLGGAPIPERFERIPRHRRPTLYRLPWGDAAVTPFGLRGDAGGRNGVTDGASWGDSPVAQTKEEEPKEEVVPLVLSDGAPDSRLDERTKALARERLARLRDERRGEAS